MIHCDAVAECRRGAVATIVVRRNRLPDRTWLPCREHHGQAFNEALILSQRIGGALHTARIEIPRRVVPGETLVHISTHVPRDLHASMIIASQGQRMSQRTFIRNAIEQAVKVAQLQEGES